MNIPWGLLSSPSWPGDPAVSRERRCCDPRAPGSLSLGAAIWLYPCLLWSLPPAETYLRHCPRATELFPTFLFLFCLMMVPSHLRRAPGITSLPRAALPLTPACSQLSQRSLSCTEGESTGPPCQLAPSSAQSLRKKQTGSEGTGAGSGFAWGWPGLSAGMSRH